MCPIELFPMGKAAHCAISAEGTLSLPQSVMDALNWQVGDEIAASYIPRPITLLLRAAPDGHPGYKLSYLSRSPRGRRGGKLTCRAFTNHILRRRVPLPQRQVPPALLTHSAYELALLLEPVPWITVECSMTGCQAVPADLTGVYQLLDGDQVPLKIGEGLIQARLREHLLDEPLVRLARMLQYYPLPKDDSRILEKVLLALYEAERGSLPMFNAIRA
ncbi:MAG: hypothetical protein K8J31_14725 [Anaerolineae bacterium]|nr:hypothetical protein [Anaerolineae bacterium]